MAAAPHHGYPSFWLEQAHCIHYEETRGSWSTGWHVHFIYGTRVESSQRGGFQINVDTWAAFAPTRWPRDPARASRAEQLLVAWRIYMHDGHSWAADDQWPGTAAACGVR